MLELAVLTFMPSYTSIRIDAVHYCWLEEELAERRKKAAKHFRSKSAVVTAGEIPNIRLSLLCRTVRDSMTLASQVLFLNCLLYTSPSPRDS